MPNYTESSITTVAANYAVDADPITVVDGSEWPTSDFTVKVWDASDPKVLKAVILVGTRTGNSLSSLTWDYSGHTDVNIASGDFVALALTSTELDALATTVVDGDGDVRFDADDAFGQAGDMAFYADNGSTLTLFWTESDSRWEFYTGVSFSSSAEFYSGVDFLGGTVDFSGTTVTGLPAPTSVEDGDGDTRFDANDVDGQVGDMAFYADDGTTVTLQWDESQVGGRWEFYKAVDFSGSSVVFQTGTEVTLPKVVGSLRTESTISSSVIAEGYSGTYGTVALQSSTEPSLYLNWDIWDSGQLGMRNDQVFLAVTEGQSVGTMHDRLVFDLAAGDMTFYDEADANILMWDESDDQWEFGKNVDFGSGTTVDFTGATVTGITVPAPTKVEDGDGDTRFDADDAGAVTGDMAFYTDDGTDVTLRWNESFEQWEIKSWLSLDKVGSDSTPTLCFIGDYDTGIWGVTDTLAFTTGGLRILTLSETSNALEVSIKGGTRSTEPAIRTKLDNDIEFYDSSDAVALRWDDSLDRWVFATAASFTGTQTESSLLLTDGASGTPSITFSNDTDTGIYRASSNSVSFASGGTQVALIGATVLRGQAVAGTFWMHHAAGTVTAPTYSFYNDSDTGIYTSGTNQMDLVAGGVSRLRVISSSGSQVYFDRRLSDVGNVETLRLDRDTTAGLERVGYYSSYEFDPETGERRKTDIQPIDLDQIDLSKVRPVVYRRMDTEQAEERGGVGAPEMGFVIEDLAAANPILTTKPGSQVGYSPDELALLALLWRRVDDLELKMSLGA